MNSAAFVSRRQDDLPRSLVSKYRALFQWTLRIGDIAVLLGAGVLAYWLRFSDFSPPSNYVSNIAQAALIAAIVFSLFPLYQSWRGRGLFPEISMLCGAWIAAFTAFVLYATALKTTHEISRAWLGLWATGCVGGSVLLRLVVRGLAGRLREAGVDVRRAVVVGRNAAAARIVDSLGRHRWAGIDVLGLFSAAADERETAAVDAPLLGSLPQVAKYVEAHRVDQVWVALPLSAEREIAALMDSLSGSTASIKFVPDLIGMQLLNHSVEQVAGLPVINLRGAPLDGETRLVKAIEDRVLAALILLLIAPLLAAIALGVKLTSPGPVLFRQKRHGLDGRVIEVWKFRSMREHSEREGQVTQATRHDPRVTPFGRFLRSTSLDELPQFFNVLQGTMSIVGPRPHAVEHNHRYKDVVQDYMQRHRMKPGITGWAQVNGLRGETDTVEKMAARVEYDLYYLKNWSLWFDLRIVAVTAVAAVKGFFGGNAY